MKTASVKGNVMYAALAAILTLGMTACERDQGTAPKSGPGFSSAPDKAARGSTDLPPGAPGSTPGQGTNTADANASDAALAAKVRAAIVADPALRSLAFDVNANDGLVTLNGTAGSRSDSDRAARLALNVEGVRSVKNELVVSQGS